MPLGSLGQDSHDLTNLRRLYKIKDLSRRLSLLNAPTLAVEENLFLWQLKFILILHLLRPPFLLVGCTICPKISANVHRTYCYTRVFLPQKFSIQILRNGGYNRCHHLSSCTKDNSVVLIHVQICLPEDKVFQYYIYLFF